MIEQTHTAVRIVLSVIVTAFFAGSGCATITRGVSESFVIETRPPGATAALSTGQSCTTPCSLKVRRRSEFVVTLSKDGYEPVQKIVTSTVDSVGTAGMISNVLLGGVGGVGLIGAGIDAGTGATHTHKPNPLHVDLVAAAKAAL